MSQECMVRLNKKILVFGLLLGLTACNSGSKNKILNKGYLSVACSGPLCDAYEGEYGRGGTGVWKYVNSSSTSSVQVPISISDTKDRTGTLIFLNHSEQEQKMSAIELDPSQSLLAAESKPARKKAPGCGTLERLASKTSRIDRQGKSFPLARVKAKVKYSVGATRSWNWQSDIDEVRQTTLIKQTVAFDGRTVNFWVEDSEYVTGKIDSAMMDYFVQSTVTSNESAYINVLYMIGQLWGETPPGAGFISEDQDLDMVFLKFRRDGHPEIADGMVVPWDFALQSVDPFSNEALSLYVNTETIYSSGGTFDEAVTQAASTIAHELTHVAHYYGRFASQTTDYFFEGWLEETSAMIFEDMMAAQSGSYIDGGVLSRVKSYMYFSAFNCDFRNASYDAAEVCYLYDVGGSMAAFFVRHLGPFFNQYLSRNLVSTDTMEVLKHSIKEFDKDGFDNFMQRYSTVSAAFPPGRTPAYYGYPGVNVFEFKLANYDGYIRGVRNLPTEVPETLAPYGSFPVIRPSLPEVYKETVIVPPNTTLSVVIY
ncbi:M30 family zinc metallopeptidase [Bdellovibrio sp. HCB274]|uniref:M30 family zinc metallopeptidase n=1 Tax=Bdellovibrio sp. HCB274 TaxID=3394361 RepID=UPI0039B4C574